MGLLLPRDEMPGRSSEMVPDIAGEVVAEKGRHQLNREKTCEREQPHADVRFAARDVTGGTHRGELRVQVDEKVEPDLVCRLLLEKKKNIVQVDELFRFDIEATLFLKFAALSGCQASAEFDDA